ncbi:MAG: DUF4835 family protein [Bacteroidota bacterium]|nr:DUF4835 family protein [Bacteroidota bacterium]
MKKVNNVIIIILLTAFGFKAQELNCQVTINSSQVQGTDMKQITDQMQKIIYDFMNNKQWTKDVFVQQEKIDCSIFITLESRSSDIFLGTIQVQSRRPTFNSSHYSTVFNWDDKDFQFQFQQFTQLDFNLQNFQSNLSSILAYYAYVIIATDYDTFSPLGGTVYWQNAQLIVLNAQTVAEPGWRSSEKTTRNRYWLVENTLTPVFQGIRDCSYAYHRNGLDIMHEKVEEGRANIIKALDLLKPVYQSRPASFNMQLFFNSKVDELINMFKGASPEEKSNIVETLTNLDPANTTKYNKITGG